MKQKIKFTCVAALFVVGISIAGNCQAQTFLTNGLVAYYQFDGNANDATGNGNNATAHGMFSYQTNSFPFTYSIQTTGDHSLAFNPYVNGGYVLFPNLTGKVTNSITVSFWAKLLDSHPYDLPMAFGMQNYAQDFIAIDLGQGFGIGDTGPQDIFIPEIVTNSSGVWQQYVITYQPGTFAGFINGQQIGQANVTVAALPLSVGALGWHQWANGTSANGSWQFAKVRIYNRALATNEVAQLYAIESAPIVSLAYAVKPTFSALAIGTNYQLQVSTSVTGTFTNFGSPFTATNNSMSYTQYFDVANWNQMFFRLQVSP